MNPKGWIKPHLDKNLTMSLLKKVVSDLREAGDIEGAILVEGKNSIITSDIPENMDPDTCLSDIMTILDDDGIFELSMKYNGLFTQHIFDYNGCKVLAKKLNDNLTLLVMIQKIGYTSLAMLDIENSIRRIHEILGNTLSNAPCIFGMIPKVELT
ncbi:MAG: hypothetical protein V3U20_01045 [Thermoplasmata archaeon]